MLDLLGILAGEPKAIERARIRREVAASHDPRDRDDGIDGRRRNVNRRADRAHRDQAGWTSSDTYLCSKDLGVPVAWYGPSELKVSFRQVSGNVFSRTP